MASSALPQISKDIAMLKKEHKQPSPMATTATPAATTNSGTSDVSMSPSSTSGQQSVPIRSISPTVPTSMPATKSTSTPLLNKESLTATKLTNIFANSNAQAATTLNRTNLKPKALQPQPQPQPPSQLSSHQIRPNPSLSPNNINYHSHVNGHQHQSHHHQKYTKIQPAIAPKPVSSSTFSPIVNSNTSLDSTLNTSKRWVLPPRPRPGRKPTTNGINDEKSAVHSSTTSKNGATSASTSAASNAITKKRNKAVKKDIEMTKSLNVANNNNSSLPKVVVKSEPKVETANTDGERKQIVSQLQQQYPKKLNTTIPMSGEELAKSTSPEIKTFINKTPTPNHKPSSSATPIPQTPPISNTSTQASSISNTPIFEPSHKPEVKQEYIQPRIQPQPLPLQQPSQTPAPSLEAIAVPSVPNAVPPPPPPPPPPNELSVDPKAEIMDLKMCYLSKLKEQEVIRNYIEVISNQIKELTFVQNGIITFDALKNNVNPINNTLKLKRLNSTSSSMNSTNSNANSSTSSVNSVVATNNIESINNLNDLNKALNYLTKSTNIIHSATKKQGGNNTSEVAINDQINHYLSIRDKFKAMKNEELKKLNSLKRQNNKKKAAQQSNNNNSNSLTNNVFTPDLLKPLKSINLFDPDTNDDVDMIIDMLNESNNNSHNAIDSNENDHDENPNGSLMLNSNSKLIDALKVNSVLMHNELISNDDDIDLIMEEPDFLSRLMLNDSNTNSSINGSNSNSTTSGSAAASGLGSSSATVTAADLLLKEQEKLGGVKIHSHDNDKGGERTINNENVNVTNNDSKNQTHGGTGNEPRVNLDNLIKKRLKLNCGFCTNDTPCLCFDTDFDLR